MTHIERIGLPSLKPGEMYDASVEMESPEGPGMYQGQWRMCTPTGMYCGGQYQFFVANKPEDKRILVEEN